MVILLQKEGYAGTASLKIKTRNLGEGAHFIKNGLDFLEKKITES